MLTSLLQHHYSLIVSGDGQSQIWRIAATTAGRQEVANLIDIWEDALIKALFLPSCPQPEKLTDTQQTIQEMNACTIILLIVMMDCHANGIFCCSAALLL